MPSDFDLAVTVATIEVLAQVASAQNDPSEVVQEALVALRKADTDRRAYEYLTYPKSRLTDPH